MKVNRGEYKKIKKLSFNEIDEIRKKIIGNSDEEALRIYFIYSIFLYFSKEYHKEPSLKEINEILNLIDVLEIEGKTNG